MFETNKSLCPIIGKVCIMDRCHFWQKYSDDVLYSGNPEIGECLLKLAPCAVITKLAPEAQEKFYDPEREEDRLNVPLELQF